MCWLKTQVWVEDGKCTKFGVVLWLSEQKRKLLLSGVSLKILCKLVLSTRSKDLKKKTQVYPPIDRPSPQINQYKSG